MTNLRLLPMGHQPKVWMPTLSISYNNFSNSSSSNNNKKVEHITTQLRLQLQDTLCKRTTRRRHEHYSVTEVNVRRWRKIFPKLQNCNSTRQAFRGPTKGRHEELEEKVTQFVREKRNEGIKFDKKLLDFDYGSEDDDDPTSPKQAPPPTHHQASQQATTRTGTPRMDTQRMGTPRNDTPRMDTPRMDTPKTERSTAVVWYSDMFERALRTDLWERLVSAHCTIKQVDLGVLSNMMVGLCSD
uniref:Uncharacterized protein n=1 Tax=Timema genevievae TaxID=629358 RepID=A0A7R9JU95_TIMGE|nr:unnamed protein product [Timema genevievae]